MNTYEQVEGPTKIMWLDWKKQLKKFKELSAQCDENDETYVAIVDIPDGDSYVHTHGQRIEKVIPKGWYPLPEGIGLWIEPGDRVGYGEWNTHFPLDGWEENDAYGSWTSNGSGVTIMEGDSWRILRRIEDEPVERGPTDVDRMSEGNALLEFFGTSAGSWNGYRPVKEEEELVLELEEEPPLTDDEIPF